MLVKEVAELVTEKILCAPLNKLNYLSTENMVGNFGGIKESSNIPKGKCTVVKPNDILLSNIRPYFKKLWFSNVFGGCSNDVINIRVDENMCLPKYIYYALSSNKFFNIYIANCKGTKMPRGNKDVLLNYRILSLSLKEQQHIVDTI